MRLNFAKPGPEEQIVRTILASTTPINGFAVFICWWLFDAAQKRVQVKQLSMILAWLAVEVRWCCSNAGLSFV